jgi:hypothetical protein
MKHGDFVHYKNIIPFFNPDNIQPLATDIFKVIYNGTMRQEMLDESVTKMFFNVVKCLGRANPNFFDHEIEIIKQMLNKTGNFDFNSVLFLFESIGFISF